MKKIFIIVLNLVLLILCTSGCAQNTKPNEKNPVTLTMWHVYGSQTQSPLNQAIDEFNRTIGQENGITINVVSVTSSSAIDKALSASANQEPGSEEMPDLFTAYPRVAEIVGKENLLAWDDYFTEQELSAFTDMFLSEGYFEDKLLMLPIAKSSEAFYLNKTLFDRFSKDTGITVNDLTTFDGLFRVANTYYDWSGGQHFMQLNDFYNYAYIGMKAYGHNFIQNGTLQLTDETFQKIWSPLAQTAIYGGICLEDGYAAARWKTVEIIANIGSTADVLYQPDEVVYSDNTTEPITTYTMPYPLFTEDSSGFAVYRGGGLFAVKSEDERKNFAAYLFAKWLTEKEQNLDFVTQTGYLPVTDDAFDALFTDFHKIEDSKYRNLYQAVRSMISDYSFHALPLYENASDIQLNFEQNVKFVLKSAHSEYQKRIANGQDSSIALQELVDSSLAELIRLSSN